MSWSKLDNAQRVLLIEMYRNVNRSRDDLPYTEEFDRMHARFVAKTGLALTAHEFWRALSSAGKTGNLPTKA